MPCVLYPLPSSLLTYSNFNSAPLKKYVKMGNGKIAAQCCHAAVGCYKRAVRSCPASLRAWEATGCAKVAVKLPSDDPAAAMARIVGMCRERGVPYYLVEDAGRTQIKAGSRTVVGVGPAPVEVVDEITGDLKLM